MNHSTVTVSQEGYYVKVKHGSGTVRVSEKGTSELVAELPHHPNETHQKANGDPTCVLPATVASLVLDDLELPKNPDERVVYVRSAEALPGHPFVHAVWFTPETADCITRVPIGTHIGLTTQLHDEWLRVCGPARSGNATQPAAGVYVELGVGTLAGTGRTSIPIAGQGTHVPYPRNQSTSDELEPCLSEFMSDVSEVLHVALPEVPWEDHEVDHACPPEAIRCYQYPQLRPGAPPLSSHQVVIRGPRGLGGGASHEQDRAAYMSTSDLHLDPCDGGGRIGSCTIHTCHNNTHMHPPESKEQLHMRGLAVFASRSGGRGVHINSMVPGWHCAILMQTAQRLHGSIQPCSLRGFGLPNYQMLRVVTYPLTAIERLLQRLAKAPEAWPKPAKVRENSHQWIQHRSKQC